MDKYKIIDAYLGTKPLSCVHLCLLVARELKGLNITPPTGRNDLRTKEYIQQFTKYAKLIEKPEDGAMAFLVGAKGKKSHAGILFKVNNKWKILHCGENENQTTKLEDWTKVKAQYKEYKLFNLDKDNKGEEISLEDAGFIFESIIFIGSFIVEAFGLAAAALGTTSLALAGKIALAAAAYLAIQNQIPDAPEQQDPNIGAQSYSLVGGSNRPRPGGPMSVVVGEYRMTPAESALPYSRNYHRIIDGGPRFFNDNYQTLHFGVNDIDYVPGSLRFGDTPFSELEDSSVLSLSGAFYDTQNDVDRRRTLTANADVYNSVVPTPTVTPPSRTIPGATPPGPIPDSRTFSLGYNDNITAINFQGYNSGNSRSSSVRLQIPSGFYIVTDMTLYRNVNNVRLLGFTPFGGTWFDPSLPGIRSPRFHYTMDEQVRQALVAAGMVETTRVVQRERSEAYGVDENGLGQFTNGETDIRATVLRRLGHDIDITVTSDAATAFHSFHIGKDSSANADERVRITWSHTGTFTDGSGSFDDNVVEQEGHDIIDNDWTVRTFRSRNGFEVFEIDVAAIIFRTSDNGGTLWNNSFWRIEFATTNEVPDENSSSWRPFNSNRLSISASSVQNGENSSVGTWRFGNGDYISVNNTQNALRSTITGVGGFDSEVVHIRVRNTTTLHPPQGIARVTQRPALERIRAVRRTGPETNYNYQNRLGVIVRSSELASGTPPRITAVVRGRCPVLEEITPSSDGSNLGSRGGGATDEILDDGTIGPRGDPGNTPTPLPGPIPTPPPTTTTQRWSFTNQITSNPAAWFRHFFLGVRRDGQLLYGLGKRIDELDDDSLIEWYNYCEDNNLKVNAVFESNRNCKEAMDILLAIGHAQITEANGRIGVWIDRAIPGQTATAIFTERDILAGSFNLSTDTTELVDGIAYQFVDADDNYISKTETIQRPLPLLPNGQTLGRGNIPEVAQSRNLFGITNSTQARHAALRQAHLQTARRQRLQIVVSTMNWGITVGDIVRVKHRAIPFDISISNGVESEDRINYGPDADKFLVQSIRYKNLQMELKLVPVSLPDAANVPSDYQNPVIPEDLL